MATNAVGDQYEMVDMQNALEAPPSAHMLLQPAENDEGSEETEDAIKQVDIKSERGAAQERRWWASIIWPLLLFASSLALHGIFFRFTTHWSSNANNGFSCRPDGSPTFPWENQRNVLWDPSLFLSITLAFGNMSYAKAKAIDICWDVVVGRGGQLLLSVTLWRTMRRSLTLMMERGPVKIPTVSSITFDRVSLEAFWTVLKQLCAGSGPAAGKNASSGPLPCFLVGISYVLIFGTLVSAMTGYQAAMMPYCRSHASGALLPASDIRETDMLVITGGHRLYLPVMSAEGFSYNHSVYPGLLIPPNVEGNETTTAVVALNVNATYEALANYQRLLSGYCALDSLDGPPIGIRSKVLGLASMSLDAGSKSSPAGLARDCINSSINLNGQIHQLSAPPLSIVSGKMYIADGAFLSQQWIRDETTCQPLKEYQWGFSSLLLITFLILTVIFALNLLILQTKVCWHSRADRLQQTFNLHRDILNVATAIRRATDHRPDDLNDTKLERRLQARRHGIELITTNLPHSRKFEFYQRKTGKVHGEWDLDKFWP